MKRVGYIYILTNSNNTTLYIGVTSDLISRVKKHINKEFPSSFSAKYNLNKLVYFKGFNSIEEAISKEKQLKAGSRKKKEELINKLNPEWVDLYEKLVKGELDI